jgi:hypothetical protein
MGNKKPLGLMARGSLFPARIRHARVPGNDMPAVSARKHLFSCDRHIDLLGMKTVEKKRAPSFSRECPCGQAGSRFGQQQLHRGCCAQTTV